MANKGVLTKILAIVGTMLVWSPILVPVLLAAVTRSVQACPDADNRSSGLTERGR